MLTPTLLLWTWSCQQSVSPTCRTLGEQVRSIGGVRGWKGMNKRQRAQGSKSITFAPLWRVRRTEAASSQGASLIEGTRIRMSGTRCIARCPRYAERTGLVVGRSRQNNSIQVPFDGYKSPVSLLPDYIEQIPSEAA